MSGEWDDLGQAVSDEEIIAKLKAERDRLARQLNEVKHKHSDYMEAFTQAVEEAVGRITVPPVRPPARLVQRPTAPRRPAEHAIALLSDLQTGKITPDYNSQVARERVIRYAHKIVKLANIQRRDHPVDGISVAMLGDMIEGVDIFPGQQWLIDSTLYDQLLNTTPTLIVEFLRILLDNFETVQVFAVDGNHGRIGRKGQYGPMDNADRMLYRIVQLLMKDQDRFSLHMTDPAGERNWYQVARWGNYSALLIHGDQIRGHSGFPWYGLGKKVNGWGSGGIQEAFGDVFLGHWHQLARIPLNHRAVWVNGSTESRNTFAAEQLAAQSDPAQWLLFVDPEAGRVTASYGVELRGE